MKKGLLLCLEYLLPTLRDNSVLTGSEIKKFMINYELLLAEKPGVSVRFAKTMPKLFNSCCLLPWEWNIP